MIGQSSVIKTLKQLDASSVLLTGPRHWGKKTLLRYLFSDVESVYEVSGNAAAFRESLERIYATVRPTVYLVPDIDNANATVQNLLLKVLEEPPLNSKFYLTASGQVLPTIVSRCVGVHSVPYTESELMNFPLPNQFIGMGSSPGIRKLLSAPGSLEAAEKLKEVVSYVYASKPLSYVLKEYREVENIIKDASLSQDWFLVVAPHIFKEGRSLDWLREAPDDNSRYVRKAFLMSYFIEFGGLG